MPQLSIASQKQRAPVTNANQPPRTVLQYTHAYTHTHSPVKKNSVFELLIYFTFPICPNICSDTCVSLQAWLGPPLERMVNVSFSWFQAPSLNPVVPEHDFSMRGWSSPGLAPASPILPPSFPLCLSPLRRILPHPLLRLQKMAAIFSPFLFFSFLFFLALSTSHLFIFLSAAGFFAFGSDPFTFGRGSL